LADLRSALLLEAGNCVGHLDHPLVAVQSDVLYRAKNLLMAVTWGFEDRVRLLDGTR
jgi:hypothetical protein